MNKRSIRIWLELVTLLLWIAGIVCAILLATEYGAIIFSGGVELKAAWSALKHIIAEALKLLVDSDSIAREIAIVNDIFDIGALSILAVVAACVCGSVSFLSLLAACCISGKQKNKPLETEAAEYLAPLSTDKPGFIVSERASPWATPTPMYSATSQGYSSTPTPTSATLLHDDRRYWGR
jgi:hypothetical protein